MGLFDGIRNLFNGQPSKNGANGHTTFNGELKSLFEGDQGLFKGQVPVAPGVTMPNFAVGTANRELFGNGKPIEPSQRGLPHVYTFASLWNTTSKTYAWRWDEAYSRHYKDALAMRRDAFLMGLLFERKYPTAQMSWHLEPDDKKNPGQKAVAEYLKACIDTLPNVAEIYMHLLEALWYGRAGGQMTWDWKQVMGRKSYVPIDVIPTNGDKVQFEWDGTPQIWLYGGVTKDSDPEKQKGVKRRALAEIPGLLDDDTVFTDRGLMLRLARPFWRDRWMIHKADLIDADFFESEQGGGIHGVGIRHWIYWLDFIRREVMSYILDFLERTGQGFTIYYFDPGNPQDQSRAIKVAKEQGRNTWIVWPRFPGDKEAQKGVERIEPNLAGAQALKDLMGYYDAIIERFIVGQSMSSGSDNESGLGGSGRANFAKQTKQYIITHDCLKLSGTLSKDLVMTLCRQNRANCEAIYGKPLDFSVRHRFDIDADDPKAQMEGAKTLWEMGVSLKEDEVRALAGLEKPSGDDAVIKNQTAGQAPTAPGAAQGGNLFGGQPGGAGGDSPDEKEKEPKPPIRYEAPMIYAGDTNLAIHCGGQEWTLGSGEEWNRFALWAESQGGELADLVRYGKADAEKLNKEIARFDHEGFARVIAHLGQQVNKQAEALAAVPSKMQEVATATEARFRRTEEKLLQTAAAQVQQQAHVIETLAGKADRLAQELAEIKAKPTPKRRRNILFNAQGDPVGWEEEDM